MGNTSTLTASVVTKNKTIHQYTVAIDTTGADITIHTPQAGNQVFLHALGNLESAVAATLTIKSGSTTIFAPEFGAGQGNWDRCCPGEYLCATAGGQALVIQSSGAITSLILHVSERDLF